MQYRNKQCDAEKIWKNKTLDAAVGLGPHHRGGIRLPGRALIVKSRLVGHDDRVLGLEELYAETFADVPGNMAVLEEEGDIRQQGDFTSQGL